ncbi:MAG: tRNA (N(6)-L-threonylcarbamoyladenosine(37)-C(2))-methylthiotransferase MtaB [Anaeroplasmataceae bacterium]|nr:tRNA (N(6)-L-threonylcarbamoyladenosine(37)-C(2))-methylthiotransferase MtaB [Anaeroplasmataceae bacterium]
MKKIGFQTLGCKVNIYESNALKNELLHRGYQIVEPSEECDAFIINTCSVTNMADAKSRKIIHKMIKLNPNAVFCVMGCYSQTSDDVLNIPEVDVIVGNGNKLDIIPLLEEKLLDKSIEQKLNRVDILNYHDFEKLEVTSYDHTRAFVKIEDGCENFCTYCIIPYARGPVRSKNAEDLILELKRVTASGFLEIVLAGIHTGKYNDNGLNLTGLIKRILKEVPLIKKLRLSSIEINEIDEEFISLLGKTSVLANHLHLPLQSGSDLILSKMERKYDLNFFIKKIQAIRAVRPDISITTDIIVGFPYETEAEFLETYSFAKKIGFSKIHVFPYSLRKGTKASLMPQVKELQKKERTKRLIDLSNQLELEYAQQFLHKKMDCIIEQETKDGFMVGHTTNYLQVHIPLNQIYLKKYVMIEVTEINQGKIYGKIIE